jgi:ATP-dependent Clp protease ATP-binding subunit ClpC
MEAERGHQPSDDLPGLAAREVMSLALAESEQLGHGYLGDEHVILGLLRGQASRASSLLRGHGLD